jgi:hypothetical protein
MSLRSGHHLQTKRDVDSIAAGVELLLIIIIRLLSGRYHHQARLTLDPPVYTGEHLDHHNKIC